MAEENPIPEEMKEKSFIGAVFEEPGSARFQESMHNVNPAQLIVAGEFFIQYGRYLMNKSFMQQEMRNAQKAAQAGIQVAKGKLQ